MTEKLPDLDALDDLQQYEEKIAALQYRRDTLYERVKEERRKKQETVTDLLHDLQESLGDGETVPLMWMTEEYGRGGRWRYTETLTSDGVVADDIIKRYGSRRSEASVGELSRWPDDEPLDIADYLAGDRTRPGYIDKLADRLQALQDEDTDIPRYSLQYTG